MHKPISKILVANRAEIACRIHRTADAMGIKTVAIFTDSDKDSPHHSVLNESYQVSSYLSMDEIIEISKKSGADAIHPGYGFLSENPQFSKKVLDSGINFIGPKPESIEAIGDKSKAREIAKSLNIPVSDGLGPFTNIEEVKNAIKQIGMPLMLKAAAGGGGKGMKRILDAKDLDEIIKSSQRESKAAFGDDRLIVERYIHPARHIEVQIFGDGRKCVALGERECSLQRRHQKIIEESPSTAISESTRKKLFESAIKIGEAVGYINAGTCEFLLGPNEQFYFLEVNARLQVEHPVTEMCTGLDLVRLQIEIANGNSLPSQNEIQSTGHAIEARLCAEDPWNEFLPSAGQILRLHWPENVRIDTGVGEKINTNFDPMIAKIIAHGSDREDARIKLIEALRQLVILGISTNQAYLIQLLESEEFTNGQTYTSTVDENGVGERPTLKELALAAAITFRGDAQQGNEMFETVGNWRLE